MKKVYLLMLSPILKLICVLDAPKMILESIPIEKKILARFQCSLSASQ